MCERSEVCGRGGVDVGSGSMSVLLYCIGVRTCALCVCVLCVCVCVCVCCMCVCVCVCVVCVCVCVCVCVYLCVLCYRGSYGHGHSIDRHRLQAAHTSRYVSRSLAPTSSFTAALFHNAISLCSTAPTHATSTSFLTSDASSERTIPRRLWRTPRLTCC